MNAFFSETPIVGILRGFTTQQVSEIVPAALRGGLKNLEVTLNSEGAFEQIRIAREMAGNRMAIGAGTVTDQKGLEAALKAGAQFIVTPALNAAVVRACVMDSIPIFPGAMSPTEIYQAWDLGATMVKIFPAETLGPKYIRAVKAPFPQVKLMPTGGVDLTTVAAFCEAGANGFGIGSPLFPKSRIEAGDWPWVEAQCAAFVAAFRL